MQWLLWYVLYFTAMSRSFFGYLNSALAFLSWVLWAVALVTWQIDREREGEQIDRALLKNVLGIFVEIGMGNMDAYENDFESAMLEDTTSYYSRKAASWILEDSCPDYMLKVSGEMVASAVGVCQRC